MPIPRHIRATQITWKGTVYSIDEITIDGNNYTARVSPTDEEFLRTLRNNVMRSPIDPQLHTKYSPTVGYSWFDDDPHKGEAVVEPDGEQSVSG